jgi:hypothetical protein
VQKNSNLIKKKEISRIKTFFLVLSFQHGIIFGSILNYYIFAFRGNKTILNNKILNSVLLTIENEQKVLSFITMHAKTIYYEKLKYK